MTPLTIFLYGIAWSLLGLAAFYHGYAKDDPPNEWSTNSWLEVFIRVLPYGPLIWVICIWAYLETYAEQKERELAAIARATELMDRIKRGRK